MRVLGIESSCDECAAAVVEDGSTILSNVVLTQIPFHERFQGVVPEIASRKHTEWVSGVVAKALSDAGMVPADLDGIAVTSRPGLIGSLLVGLSFGKAMAWALKKPLVGVNHILAHLYASRLETPAPYPFLGLLVSGGHCIICRMDDFDRIEVIGTTIDDAVGEAFDKVAKHYGFGYPGGACIDRLAALGDDSAFAFPIPDFNKGTHMKTDARTDVHRYDMSFSGLKTAVIHQLELFRRPDAPATPENIAASFQKAAIDILLSKLFKAVEDTGLATVVAGGGVAANSYLRRVLAARGDLKVVFPSQELCGDNGAMIAGIGCRYIERGDVSPLSINVEARVPMYKRQGGRR